MRKHSKKNMSKTSVVSVIVVVVLLLLSGWGYRATAERFGRAAGGVVLPKGTLGKFPDEFAGWRGKEVPLDVRIVEATDSDDLIHREYRDQSGVRRAVFYVAYGIQLRDLAPHRPEVCYPSAGWTVDKTDRLEISLEDGSVLPCQIHVFKRGGLQSDTTTVLHYYIVDGQYCADVSLLRSAQRERREGDHAYAVQVQIIAPGTLKVVPPEQTVKDFAAAVGARFYNFITSEVAKTVAAQTQLAAP